MLHTRQRIQSLKAVEPAHRSKTGQIKRVLDPVRSFNEQIKEEVSSYERLKRGEFDELQNFSGIGRLLIALRIAKGLTQREFAEAFHLPLTTLRDWEQRRSVPDAPARALLLAIERDPKKMMSLLAPATV